MQSVKALARFWSGRNHVVAVFSGLAIAVHLVLQFAYQAGPEIHDIPLKLALVLGGAVLLADLFLKIARRELGSDFLAGLSIVVSFVLQEYLAGTIIVLMLSGGSALEGYAVNTASSVLRALAKRTPTRAHRKLGLSVIDIDVNDVVVGETLIIFPHEISPVDGVVVEGNGTMDESFLTGEPFQISKAPGSVILSGSINGETALVMKATKRPVDSRLAKIMEVVKATEQNPPKLRRLADQIGAIYVPIVLVLSVLTWVLSGSSHRFLAVLVIATPCPLILAIPIAIIGSISLCARRGIIVKKPTALEQIQACRTIIFDKTGTLTYGRPMLTDQNCSPGFERDDVLAMTASLERYSRHPLAQAILEAAKKKQIDLLEATEVGEKPGHGLSGTVNGHKIHVLGRSSAQALPSMNLSGLPPAAKHGLETLVFVDGVYAATYQFQDEPRAEGLPFIAHLGPKHLVDRKIILSGDRESEVRALAEKVGISEVHGGKSPEEKLGILYDEMKKAKTVFVGDGINDAPALLASTVGIAVGMNSDITSEAAGVVILDSSLSKIDEFLHISQRMRAIALQSAIGGMILSAGGMALAAFGYLSPVEGAILQEVIDILAILNALRAAFLPKILVDF